MAVPETAVSGETFLHGPLGRWAPGVRIGSVGRPHGLEGAFHVVAPTDRLRLLEPGRTVLVEGVEREIEWRAGTPAKPLLRLAGVAHRCAAEQLRGSALEVSHEQFGALEEGQHLVRDLIGCAVTDGERRVGVVRDVLNLPSVDCLAVEREDAPPGQELLVPLVRDAVRLLDLGARRVDVDLAFMEPE
jgi:16S rRNA processing protein RimM